MLFSLAIFKVSTKNYKQKFFVLLLFEGTLKSHHFPKIKSHKYACCQIYSVRENTGIAAGSRTKIIVLYQNYFFLHTDPDPRLLSTKLDKMWYIFTKYESLGK
jgi:hypothetical protein